MAKQLKSTRRTPDTAALMQVAAEAGRSLPAAVVRQDKPLVMVNIKMTEDSAVALAQQAKAQGITQKQLVCRALHKAGVPIDPQDLEDRTPRRRAA
jgi:hypothetical protein